MRLWDELGPFHHCPFSGIPIPLHKLFTHEIEVEHLIPYADSLDNKAANKTVCYAAFNRLKGKKTPYEAYSALPEWPKILARANELPPKKRWRFASDARERINRDGRDFIERQLHETSWLAKLAKQYVGAVCDPNQVWVVTGQHTGLIRDKWGLSTLLPDHNYTNAKNRADHRHHALDACVIAMTDRSLLQRITKDYARGERHRIVVETPWDSFRTDLQNALARITVSHRRDHGVQGKLHDETAYGFVANPLRPDEENLVYRKPLVSLTSNEIDSIRDERLRQLVRSFVDEKIAAGVKHEDALKTFNESVQDPQFKHGLRRVRILKSKNPKYLLQLRQREDAAYKAYAADSNLYMEIFERPDGVWSGEAVTVHQANQDNIVMRWPSEYPEAKLLMRVYKDDLVRIEYEGVLLTARVVRLEPSQKRIRLAAHHEAGSLEDRHKNPNDPYRWIFAQYDRLKEWKARPVRVDELGRTKVIKPVIRTTTT